MSRKDEFLLQLMDRVSVSSENFTNNIEDFTMRERVVIRINFLQKT